MSVEEQRVFTRKVHTLDVEKVLISQSPPKNVRGWQLFCNQEKDTKQPGLFSFQIANFKASKYNFY